MRDAGCGMRDVTALQSTCVHHGMHANMGYVHVMWYDFLCRKHSYHRGWLTAYPGGSPSLSAMHIHSIPSCRWLYCQRRAWRMTLVARCDLTQARTSAWFPDVHPNTHSDQICLGTSLLYISPIFSHTHLNKDRITSCITISHILSHNLLHNLS